MKNNNAMRYTALQFAVLSTLFNANGQPVSLTDLAGQVYRSSRRRKPKTARQAIAACVRGMEKKLSEIKVNISRETPIGRGYEASYLLKGKLDNVKQIIEGN